MVKLDCTKPFHVVLFGLVWAKVRCGLVWKNVKQHVGLYPKTHQPNPRTVLLLGSIYKFFLENTVLSSGKLKLKGATCGC